MTELNTALQEWLKANESAVDEAAKCMTKKGNFNPPLEKPWPAYDALRAIANEKWYAYMLLRSVQPHD